MFKVRDKVVNKKVNFRIVSFVSVLDISRLTEGLRELFFSGTEARCGVKF